MYDDLIRAAGRVKEPKEHAINFGPFNGGLVTAKPPHMLARNECSEMTNMVVSTDGIPKTRPGMSSAGSLGSTSYQIDCVRDVRVGGTWYTIVGATEGSTYQLFYVVGTNRTQIGNDTMFKGELSFIGFNNLLIIFDGSYVKYWDGTDVAVLEDQGIGAKTQYIVENLDGDVYPSSPVPHEKYDLKDTLYTKYGAKFTTPAIGADFDVPEISFSVKMAKVGDGASAAGIAGEHFVKAVIRDATTYASLGSKDLILPADLSAVAATPSSGVDPAGYDTVEGSFTSSEMTTALAADTQYLLCIEYDYTDGAGGNYLAILVPSTGGTGDLMVLYIVASTSWYTPTSKSLAVDIVCATPPKLKYGVNHNSRVFGIEGIDGNNPDYVWYSGAGNHLDWSSENSGGYLTAGFDVNALASYYGSLFLFGSEKNPALKRMTGAIPSEYSLTSSIQEVSASQKSIVSTPNDIIFLHSSGVSSINTMQEFGDVRASNRSDDIKPEILNYYDEAALSAYEPRYGIYLLKLNDSTDTDIYAIHTKVVSKGRYVITLWRLAIFSGLITIPEITSMDEGENCVYIGTDSGTIYKIDYTTLEDDGNLPSYSIKSRVFLSQHMNLTAARYYAMLSSNGNGGSVDFKLYRNQSTTALQSETITLPTDLSGAQPDSGAAYLRAFGRKRLNFDFWALQVSFENIVPVSDNPIYFGDIQVLAR